MLWLIIGFLCVFLSGVLFAFDFLHHGLYDAVMFIGLISIFVVVDNAMENFWHKFFMYFFVALLSFIFPYILRILMGKFKEFV